MRKEEKVRVCDMCQKKVSDGGEKTFGSSAFGGWFSVQLSKSGKTLREMNTQNEWDVCGVDCLRKLANERLK